MMVKQNSALIFLFVFCALIIGLVILKYGLFTTSSDLHPANTQLLSQESMGDPILTQDKPAAVVNADGKKNFAESVKKIAECLLTSGVLPEDAQATDEVF